MAKINSHKLTIVFNLVSILFIVLMVSMAESRFVVGRFATTKAGLVCDKVVGVKSGDTCFAIAQQSGLTTESFAAINPNLNCLTIFVGQWLCISGKST